jgi:hypothetical protein
MCHHPARTVLYQDVLLQAVKNWFARCAGEQAYKSAADPGDEELSLARWRHILQTRLHCLLQVMTVRKDALRESSWSTILTAVRHKVGNV